MVILQDIYWIFIGYKRLYLIYTLWDNKYLLIGVIFMMNNDDKNVQNYDYNNRYNTDPMILQMIKNQ